MGKVKEHQIILSISVNIHTQTYDYNHLHNYKKDNKHLILNSTIYGNHNYKTLH